MKINRHLTVALLALMFAVKASARDVTVFLNGMSEGQTFSLQLLDKIYFSDGNLVLNRSGEETKVPLSMIKKLCFPNTSTGVSQTSVADADIKAFVVGDDIKLVGYDHSKPLAADLYGMNGSRYMSVKALTSDALNVASLPKGIYILKLGNKTFKLYK